MRKDIADSHSLGVGALLDRAKADVARRGGAQPRGATVFTMRVAMRVVRRAVGGPN